MSQQQQTLNFNFKKMFNNLNINRSNTQPQHDNQQWFINKQEFSIILQKIVQKQQLLQQKIQNLQMEIRSLRNVQKAYHIIKCNYDQIKIQQKIKDKMIDSLRDNYEKIQREYKQYQQDQQKMNNTSRYLQSSLKNKSRSLIHKNNDSSSNKNKSKNIQPTKLKKICLRKKKNNQISQKIQAITQRANHNQKDTQVVKLISQISLLKNKIWQYQSQISLLKIQNQHLLIQNQTICRRQRQIYQKSITLQDKRPLIKSQNLKYQSQIIRNVLSQQFSDNHQFYQTDKFFKKPKSFQHKQSLPLQNLQNKNHDHNKNFIPPITPHFSTSTSANILKLSYFPRNHTQTIHTSFVDELVQVQSQNQSNRFQSQSLFLQNYDSRSNFNNLCYVGGQNII